jgi:hypothetical protein
MGTAEHQPRVGDKRSSAQPCSAETLTTIAHDTDEGCKGMRRLSISSSICIPARKHIVLYILLHGVLGKQRIVTIKVRYEWQEVASNVFSFQT